MIVRFLKAVAAAALVMGAAIDARADSYFGGSVGSALTYPTLAELSVSEHNLSQYGFGTDCVSAGCFSSQNEPDAWKVFVGVRSGESFAVEGFYARLGRYHSFADDGFGVTAAVDARIETAGIAAVGFTPLSHNATMFYKAGLHAWRMEGVLDLNDTSLPLSVVESFETDGNGLMIGVGAEVDITPHLALRAEYEAFGGWTDGGDFVAELFSVGALARF